MGGQRRGKALLAEFLPSLQRLPPVVYLIVSTMPPIHHNLHAFHALGSRVGGGYDAPQVIVWNFEGSAMAG